MSRRGPAPRTEDLRRAFFGAAEELLATEGYGGLKQSAVCARLGVTTGSFYHSFGSWSEFTTALLDDWRRERTDAVIAVAEATTDPVDRLRMLAEVTTGLHHGAEAAIRVWAAVDPAVAQVQREVDDARVGVVRSAFVQLVGEAEADHYTAWAYSVLVGREVMAGRLPDGDDGDGLAWSMAQILAVALTRAADPQVSPGG